MKTVTAPNAVLEQKLPEVWQQDEETRSYLRTLLRPLLMAMALRGGYNFDNLKVDGSTTETRKWLWNATFLYRLIILGILLFYITKTLAAFFYISRFLFEFNGMFFGWLLLCLVWYILFWKGTSEKYGKLNKVFKMWDNTIMPKFQEMYIQFPDKQIKRRVNILLVLGIMLTLTNTLGFSIQIAIADDTFTRIYTIPLASNGFTITVILICFLFCSAIWVFPNMYVAAITFTLKKAFQLVRKEMNNSLCNHACSVPPDFQKLRILHLNLCTLVSEFDIDFGWYYATLFVWHIGLACFNLHQVFCTEVDTFTAILYVFWAVSALAILCFASSFAAMVYEEAHAPLDNIYYINVSNVDMEKLAQINLFLSKLTGTQVGFSTCGLLIITKEFILTIAGVFLTYTAVLYTL